ncbi:Zn-finger domain associated with topoisomerase type I [Variovorax sp. PBL-H6]|uniref:restriction endonuclease n=1 Tax=Variovorax sp. PBL-H6 TaxID=434009 RepID=UPI001318ABD6|nr:restriction endonuclease [Variovorax sp. PBL-H6]VTU21381.1 Zn-finger domain associated with topoisomerase type I [Variovorax sp. PBL-H6]
MPRRRKSSALDDMIELVSMLPWWAGAVMAPICYLLLHAWAVRVAAEMIAKPQLTSGIYYALGSVGQYLLPFICLAGAAMSAWRRHQRKTLADNVSAAKTADVLEGMSWREFELLVGEGFRRKGFQVEELGGAGADGGVDLVLRKGGEKYLVQCKQWRAYKVTVQVVRELYGVMAASGAAGGFVVTSGRFTADAREFAQGRNVQLMDGDALFALIRSVREKVRDVPSRAAEGKPRIEPELVSNASAAPACPRCAGQMVRRTAKKGANAGEAFWGCGAFPKCRGTA